MRLLPIEWKSSGSGRYSAILSTLFVFVFGAGFVAACTSVELPVNEVKKHADVVFRGTITQYRDTGNGVKIAVFEVTRVWKGRVGRTVEMSTYPGYSDAPCAFFSTRLLEIGSDELVFARKVKGHDYLTNYWSGTRPAKDYPYLSDLGPGRPPYSSE